MKLILLLSTLISFPLYAADSCQEFKYIQSNITNLTQKDLQVVMREPEWLDEKFRKDDRKQAAWIIGKTIVLTLLNRISPVTYLFDATRTGVADFPGIYSSNPNNYLTFLQLKPEVACGYLRLKGHNPQRLRDITHELALEIYNLNRL